MRIFLMVSAAALIAVGSLPAQACPGAQASATQATLELAAATAKKKTAKKPAKKKQKIEYMRATG